MERTSLRTCVPRSSTTMAARPSLNGAHTPTPPCNSYAKVLNQYGPYSYCSLDKAVDAQIQKEKIAW